MLRVKSGVAEVFIQFRLVLFTVIFFNDEAFKPGREMRHTGTAPEAVAGFGDGISVTEPGRLGTKCCRIPEALVAVEPTAVDASLGWDDC